MIAERARDPRVAGVRYRRPLEADYERIVEAVEEWWSESPALHLLPRLWLQHFTGTSWLAELDGGGLAGFLIGFMSPDRPDVAFCVLVGTSPNLRRRGLGRELYERFFADAAAAGRRRVVTTYWPANRSCRRFHEALGFEPEVGPGSQNLYGAPAYAGYDFGREDRSVVARAL